MTKFIQSLESAKEYLSVSGGLRVWQGAKGERQVRAYQGDEWVELQELEGSNTFAVYVRASGGTSRSLARLVNERIARHRDAIKAEVTA